MSAAIRLPENLVLAIREHAGLAPGSGTRLDAVLAGLFAEQSLFVHDGAHLKAALCSRRAGKSHGIAAWLYEGACGAPDGLSAYIGLSRAATRRTAWAAFKKLNRVYGLKLDFGERDGQLQVTHPNGHIIWLAGCGDASEIDKFRGATEGLVRVAVDEAQAFGGYLQELVEDALEPACLDNDGQIALTGTPGPVCAGYFHTLTTQGAELGVPTYHWTMFQNTGLREDPRAYADRIMRQRGWDSQHPSYRREYLGEWVNDAGALVYPMTRQLNLHSGALPDDLAYTLGVDLGFRDATAFVLVATQRGSGRLYVLSAEKREGMLPQSIGARIMQYRERFPHAGVVVDEGGLGKGYAEQMRADGVPCRPAEKSTKRAAQEWLRGMLLAGAVHVDWTAARCLVDEASTLTWNEEGDAEDDRFPNHACDALLYAARAALPMYRPELELPQVGTPEWHAAQQAAWKQQRIADLARAKRKGGMDALRRIAVR